MVTPTTSILVNDNGVHHKQFFQIQLKRIEGEEELFIKYEGLHDFFPLSVMLRDDKIMLGAALISKFAEIKISVKEWLGALKRLGSKDNLESWESILNQLKVA